MMHHAVSKYTSRMYHGRVYLGKHVVAMARARHDRDQRWLHSLNMYLAHDRRSACPHTSFPPNTSAFLQDGEQCEASHGWVSDYV